MITPATAYGFINGVLPRSSVGYHTVVVELSWDHKVSSSRTVRGDWGYVALESDANTNRSDEIPCIAHPFGRIAQRLRRVPSFRSLVGAPPVSYQLLVHRLISRRQLLPRFRGRQTTEPGIGSSINMTFFFKTGYKHDGPVKPPASHARLTTQRWAYTCLLYTSPSPRD